MATFLSNVKGRGPAASVDATKRVEPVPGLFRRDAQRRLRGFSVSTDRVHNLQFTRAAP